MHFSANIKTNINTNENEMHLKFSLLFIFKQFAYDPLKPKNAIKLSNSYKKSHQNSLINRCRANNSVPPHLVPIKPILLHSVAIPLSKNTPPHPSPSSVWLTDSVNKRSVN